MSFLEGSEENVKNFLKDLNSKSIGVWMRYVSWTLICIISLCIITSVTEIGIKFHLFWVGIALFLLYLFFSLIKMYRIHHFYDNIKKQIKIYQRKLHEFYNISNSFPTNSYYQDIILTPLKLFHQLAELHRDSVYSSSNYSGSISVYRDSIQSQKLFGKLNVPNQQPKKKSVFGQSNQVFNQRNSENSTS